MTWTLIVPSSSASVGTSPAAPSAGDLPTLAIDDGAISVHVIDLQRWRGRVSDDSRAARLWRDEIDAVLQRCEAAFPVNTLGL